MRIDIRNFNGEMPRVDNEILPDNYATTAINVDTRKGTLSPRRDTLSTGIALASGTQTIFKYNRESNSGNGFWFEFDTDVDIEKGPVLRDPNLRTYFTGDGKPKFTAIDIAQSSPPYPSAVYDLGLPSPDPFFAVGPALSTKPDDAEEVSTFYAVRFVDIYGARSAPSDPTAEVIRWDGASVSLTGLPVASGNFVVNTKQLFRAELGGEFQFVAEIPNSQTTYDDSIESRFLGTALEGADWLPPPENLSGLTEIGNGVFMGFYDFTLAFSEPYQPHAWPPGYEIPLLYKPVAAVETSVGVIVMTEGKPFIVTGDDPSSMSADELDISQACVSKRSAVDMGEYALYASPEGLVAIGGSRSELVTESIILPEQWRALEPEKIHAYRVDDRYLAFYPGGSFTFDLNEGLIFYAITADTGYLDKVTGELYLKQGNDLVVWDHGNAVSYEWSSKVWRSPKDQFLRAMKINCASYPIDVEIFQDGVSVKNITLNDNKAFTVPALKPYEAFQFSISGSNEVKRIQIASTRSEMQ